MSLKTIPYMEVVYASCRKGIDAPYGGFCVKTHSEGMPRDVLEAVSSPTKVCSYDRPTKELPTLEELRDDPSLFFDHPAAWLYTPVTTEGGREVYVFARSVFVGVEYGFFDGSGQRRQGSNFVTHALVFEQPVPIEVMKMPGLFLPVSTDGEAYMEEMRELLCGEREYWRRFTAACRVRLYSPSAWVAERICSRMAATLSLYRLRLPLCP